MARQSIAPAEGISPLSVSSFGPLRTQAGPEQSQESSRPEQIQGPGQKGFGPYMGSMKTTAQERTARALHPRRGADSAEKERTDEVNRKDGGSMHREYVSKECFLYPPPFSRTSKTTPYPAERG